MEYFEWGLQIVYKPQPVHQPLVRFRFCFQEVHKRVLAGAVSFQAVCLCHIHIGNDARVGDWVDAAGVFFAQDLVKVELSVAVFFHMFVDGKALIVLGIPFQG